jgi:dipeptide/tripeptide permease
MSLIHNESTKLTAAWFNTLAAATVVAGVIAPMAALVFGVPTSATISTAAFALAAIAWLGLGVVLHVLAKIALRRLRE